MPCLDCDSRSTTSWSSSRAPFPPVSILPGQMPLVADLDRPGIKDAPAADHELVRSPRRRSPCPKPFPASMPACSVGPRLALEMRGSALATADVLVLRHES